MKRIKLAYFGSPDFSADFLEKLLTDNNLLQLIEVKLVVTQKDQPIGRDQIITQTPVKQVAKKYSIITFDQSIESIGKELKGVDLALIYFYGQIIPKDILTVPTYGFWNIHFSALPKLRGPAPAAYSLALGEEKTAISIVQTDEKVDHGDLVAQLEVKIKPNERRLDLAKRLGALSYDFFVNEVKKLVNKTIKLTPQDQTQSTYGRFPTKDDGFVPLSVIKKALKNEPMFEFEIPKMVFGYLYKYKLLESWKLKLNNSSQIIYNYFRGLFPWPGIWTTLPNNKRLKITDMSLDTLYAPRSTLYIKKVQLEGKKEVDFETFNKAYKMFL